VDWLLYHGVSKQKKTQFKERGKVEIGSGGWTYRIRKGFLWEADEPCEKEIVAGGVGTQRGKGPHDGSMESDGALGTDEQRLLAKGCRLHPAAEHL